MALALLRWTGEDDGWQHFDIDIGSSRYYAWAIGSSTTSRNGIPVMSTRTHVSDLLGPLQAGRRGRTVLRVPSDSFSADNHRIQLLSFRDEQMRGPAASDPVDVPWRWTPPSGRNHLAHATSSTPGHGTVEAGRVISIEQQLSHAQFLDALMGAVSNILPAVKTAIPLVERIVGGVRGSAGGGGAGRSGTPSSSAPTSSSGTSSSEPDIVELITQLLQQLKGVTAPAATPAPATSASMASSTGAAPVQQYSFASWAQLLAALPALAPVLQKVLTPETVQAVVGAADPNKLLKTTVDGLTQIAKVGQEATNKLHEHLRELNPGLGDDVLIPLLASMSTAQGAPRFKLSRRVRLGIADLAPVELEGYPQVAFRHGDEIALPITVDTDRPIPRPTLRACLKDTRSLVPVATREWRFRRLEAGRVPVPTVIPSTITARLDPAREYLIDLSLTWQGRSGRVGTTTGQLVRIVGRMVFDTMDTGGTPIRLDDVDRDRSWWHRVWSGQFDEETRRLDADVSYAYRIATGDENVRRRTKVEWNGDGRTRRVRGTVTSGLDVSLTELSRLLRSLTGESLSSDVVEALRNEQFAAKFGRRARTHVSLRGRRGAQGAVWVWPEVKLHDVTFQEPDEISPLTGQVLSFTPRVVTVPVPAIAHVVTTKSS